MLFTETHMYFLVFCTDTCFSEKDFSKIFQIFSVKTAGSYLLSKYFVDKRTFVKRLKLVKGSFLESDRLIIYVLK